MVTRSNNRGDDGSEAVALPPGAAATSTADDHADQLAAIQRQLAELVKHLPASGVLAPARFLTIAGAAERTSLSPATIRRLLAMGKLTALRPARGRVLVDVHELDRFVLNSSNPIRRGRGCATRERNSRNVAVAQTSSDRSHSAQ